MRKKTITFLGILLITVLLTGCSQEPQKPEGALSAAELLENPIYDTQTRVYGEVSALRELACTCFFLQSEGENLYVWYDTMSEDDGSPTPPTRTPVDVAGIKNGDWIIVTGELKFFEDRKVHEDFWLTEFEIIQKNK